MWGYPELDTIAVIVILETEKCLKQICTPGKRRRWKQVELPYFLSSAALSVLHRLMLVSKVFVQDHQGVGLE